MTMPFSKQKQPQKGYLSFVIVFFREARPCGLGANLIPRHCLGAGDLGVPPKRPTAHAAGLFGGFTQQFRTFTSTKQKSQNSKNNCWTQYQKPYVFITAQFDIFIVFFYFPQTVYWKMNHIKRFCVIFI